VSGCSASWYQPKALSDVQFSMAARPGRHPGGGAWIALRATTRSAKGDGPKTPEHIGYSPTGTSLLSSRWGYDVSIPEAGRRQEQRRAAGGSSVLGKVVHPCREVYLVD
jgi:hypothetical protein